MEPGSGSPRSRIKRDIEFERRLYIGAVSLLPLVSPGTADCVSIHLVSRQNPQTPAERHGDDDVSVKVWT